MSEVKYNTVREESTRPSGLAEALARAQAEFTPVPKTKVAKVRMKAGGTYQYKYADLADVLAMALPILARQGIAFSQPLKRKEGKLYLVTTLRFRDELEQSDGLELPQGITPQEFGSYLTYWRRYDGCSLLGIAPDADEDGAIASARAIADEEMPANGNGNGRAEVERKREEQASNGYISEDGRRAIFRACGQAGVSHDDLKQYLREQHAVDSTAKITPDIATEVLQWLGSIRAECEQEAHV